MIKDYREIERLAEEAQDRANKYRAEKKLRDADNADLEAFSLRSMAKHEKKLEHEELQTIVNGGSVLSGIGADAGEFPRLHQDRQDPQRLDELDRRERRAHHPGEPARRAR